MPIGAFYGRGKRVGMTIFIFAAFFMFLRAIVNLKIAYMKGRIFHELNETK